MIHWPKPYTHFWHIDQLEIIAWLNLSAGPASVDVPWYTKGSDGPEVFTHPFAWVPTV